MLLVVAESALDLPNKEVPWKQLRPLGSCPEPGIHRMYRFGSSRASLLRADYAAGHAWNPYLAVSADHAVGGPAEDRADRAGHADGADSPRMQAAR